MINIIYSAEEAGSDGNEDAPTEQLFDKSLNLTPGRVLEPAAMNWKTERSSRLSEQAKSMMGHFKIAGSSGDVGGAGSSMSGSNRSSAGQEREKSELWKRYLTRYNMKFYLSVLILSSFNNTWTCTRIPFGMSNYKNFSHMLIVSKSFNGFRNSRRHKRGII